MKSPRSISLFAAATTLAVAWLVAPVPVFAQNYQTIDPPGTTYTIAQGINANGQIVGFYEDSNHTEHGFLDSKGIYTTIDPPDSVETIADNINSQGQIIGYYFVGAGPQQGFVYSHGTYTTIAPPGSINGNLYINKVGEISELT